MAMNADGAGNGQWLRILGLVYLIRAIRRRRQRRRANRLTGGA